MHAKGYSSGLKLVLTSKRPAKSEYFQFIGGEANGWNLPFRGIVAQID